MQMNGPTNCRLHKIAGLVPGQRILMEQKVMVLQINEGVSCFIVIPLTSTLPQQFLYERR